MACCGVSLPSPRQRMSNNVDGSSTLAVKEEDDDTSSSANSS
jgi:hypothetical protein